MGGKNGVRVNAAQAERWTESKSLRDFSVGLYLPFIGRGVTGRVFLFLIFDFSLFLRRSREGVVVPLQNSSRDCGLTLALAGTI